MSWLRKLVQVFAVIGLAALSSIPFKRNAPQTSSSQGPSADSRVASNPSSSDATSGSAGTPGDTDQSKTVASAPTLPGTVTTGGASDGTIPTGGSGLSASAGMGDRQGGDVSNGSSAAGPKTPGTPPPTSYGTAESTPKSSDFSSSDRPLPEADSSVDRPASVARLEIRAPRIVGDPPRDVRIRDDEPVPSMGANFQPLWQPDATKRRIAEPDDKQSLAGEKQGNTADVSGSPPTGNSVGRADVGDSASSPKHRVVYGDSLESLAQQYLGDAARADAIYDLNRDRIPDRYSLPVGVELSIPKRSE